MLIGLSGLLGLIWLATIPLTSGLVATFFGTAWLSMLYGVVIFCHQIGAFLGVWLGGRIFDLTRSYDSMWWISAGLGLGRRSPALAHQGTSRVRDHCELPADTTPQWPRSTRACPNMRNAP